MLDILLDKIDRKRCLELDPTGAVTPGSEVRGIGVLRDGAHAIEIVVDYSYIWANGVAIINCYNDWHTASGVFKDAADMFVGPGIWTPNS